MKNGESKYARHTNYLTAALVSLGFLVLGILFVFYVGNQSRQETMRYINEAVRQSQYNVDAHIDEEFQTLGTGIILNEEREWLAEDASFGRMVKRLLSNNTYVRVGIASIEGEALWADREGRTGRSDLSNEEYFEKAQAEKNAISETRFDELSGIYVNDYAIPAYAADGTLQGVVFASDPEDELRTIADNSLFANEGFTQIIKSNGDFVVKSQSPLRLSGEENLFDLPEPLKPEKKQNMLDDMSLGRSGTLRATFGHYTRVVAYAPSKHNDWYIFYSVPEHKVNAGLHNITFGAMSVIGMAGIVFLFLILMIRRSNKKNQRELECLAFIDPLTGGRSQQKFMIDAKKLLEGAPREGYAVCYVDIKGLKYINDIFGRSTGDALLRYLWELLSDDSHGHELCARASADKFVAIRWFEDKGIAKERYQKIAENLSSFSLAATHGYKVEIYGGVYMMDKQDGNLPLEDMLDRALEAHQDVKRRGGGSRVGFYTNEMRWQKLWETEVESRMEQALEKHEFKMYLQPKIGIQQGNRVIGMEALVRWEPPGQALLPPSRFIDLFERNGFIVLLDRYMVEEACRTYQELELASMNPPPILSVNISRLSLLQSEVVQVYTGIKDSYGIPGGLIELEFTEGLLFENHDRFQALVEQFRENGFLTSLDDFGAGYSSLNMIKSLRVDVLKLDKLFFDYSGDEARGRELVRVMISLAKFLHMETVAEGIEEEEEVQWLRKIGCDVVQGYVFSKPLPVEAFMRFLKQWKSPGDLAQEA